jgi:hypothetical protein
VLANLSGFDGSPESLRQLQLEYGAEIGRAVVNFDGLIVFAVIGRYHGGAYVVFSKALNSGLTAVALDGAYASVIGGAPAAAVVFGREIREQAELDPRVRAARATLLGAAAADVSSLRAELDRVIAEVIRSEQARVARHFDSIHTVDRAVRVRSLDAVLSPEHLRAAVIDLLAKAFGRFSRSADSIATRSRAQPPCMSRTRAAGARKNEASPQSLRSATLTGIHAARTAGPIELTRQRSIVKTVTTKTKP